MFLHAKMIEMDLSSSSQGLPFCRPHDLILFQGFSPAAEAPPVSDFQVPPLSSAYMGVAHLRIEHD